jgi:hypothetical protein
MSSSINDFKSAILRNKGFAKANRFMVEITSVPGLSGSTRDLNFLCETVNLPGKQITTLEYDNGTRRSVKIPTGYIDDDVTMVFNLTNNYFVKTAIDAWMQRIININSYRLAYDTAYKRDIKISQLDENNSIVYTYTLYSAYPITLNSIDLDNNSESTIAKATVIFTHDPYKSNVESFVGDINVPTRPVA